MWGNLWVDHRSGDDNGLKSGFYQVARLLVTAIELAEKIERLVAKVCALSPS